MLWIGQAYIKVAGHQHLGPLEPPADSRSDVLYGQGVVGGDVTPHRMPVLPSRLQM